MRQLWNGLGDSYTAHPQANDGPFARRHQQQEAIDGRLSSCDASLAAPESTMLAPRRSAVCGLMRLCSRSLVPHAGNGMRCFTIAMMAIVLLCPQGLQHFAGAHR